MTSNKAALGLAAMTDRRLALLVAQLPVEPRRGRSWSRPRRQRVLIACAALRTNLTMRELGACFAISKSTAHRIVSTMTPQLAALAASHPRYDRRESWVVDGTLKPTRDHSRAAKSKNERWSCNAQILIRRRDLRIVATIPCGRGNRCTTVARGSRHDVANTIACSPTAAIVASASW
jgi:hypothetical protein